jgi:hypothetical protein
LATTQFSPEDMSADISSHVPRTWPRRFAARNDEILDSSKINNLRVEFMVPPKLCVIQQARNTVFLSLVNINRTDIGLRERI